jgi:hypothetical protein
MPYISTPLLVQASQYDLFQVPYDCCSPPFSSTQLAMVERIRLAFRTSMGTVIREQPQSTAFSPACFTHCLTEGADFGRVSIDGTTLQQFLSRWLSAPQPPLIDNCVGFNCTATC